MNVKLTAIAHDIRSAHNVGSIYRTADGAGFNEIVISGYSPGPDHTGVVKVALGAEQTMTTTRCESLDELLATLGDSHVIALEQHESSVQPSALEIPEGVLRVCLIVGGELTGLPEALVERANTILELPMRGSKESLNVSVAFGIAAYAVADAILIDNEGALRSRADFRTIRPGVLTLGPTIGESRTRSPFLD